MRVTLFSGFDSKLNPYILLFKKSLEDEGIRVELEREFSLRWLLSKGRFSDSIHLHWISFVFDIYKEKVGSRSIGFLLRNRLVKILLEAMGLVDFFVALSIARLQGKIVTCTIHDLDHFGKPFGKQSLRGIMFIRVAHHILFLFAHSIHVHNHYTQRLMETRYRKKDNIVVIPHGNYIGYYPNQVSKSEARRQLDLPEKAFVYLFLGLLRSYKGLEDLFKVFKRLKWPECQLVVAGRVFGDNTLKRELCSLAFENSNIKLIPEFIPDEAIQLYMNACDVFILPYQHITTSGAAALALSFGRPVIAPSITSFPEIINTKAGILYDTSGPNGLLTAMREARTRSWSEAEILDHARKFDWNKLGPEILNLYRNQSNKRS